MNVEEKNPTEQILTAWHRFRSAVSHICCDKGTLISGFSLSVSRIDRDEGYSVRREWQQGLRTGWLLQRYQKRQSLRRTGCEANKTCFLVFAGKDASRALAQSSLKAEECRPDWYDLSDEYKKVLNDWYTFFGKRYNIKGKVEGATNT